MTNGKVESIRRKYDEKECFQKIKSEEEEEEEEEKSWGKRNVTK